MDNTQEFARLLAMDDAQLERAVVEAVSGNERLMARVMPQAIPPMSVDDYLRNATKDDLRNSVLGYIKLDYENTKDDLYQLICVQLKYCERKKRAADFIGLLGFVCNHYVTLALVAFPHCWMLPAAVVYLSKKFLDKLCRCK